MGGNTDALQWIAQIQQGRDVEHNSRLLFKAYYGWVRGFFTRRRLPPERAEELAQETLFQAFQHLRSFRGDGSFESWLFAIAANQLRNEHRRLSQRKRDAPEVSIEASTLDDEKPLELADGAASPEAATLMRERLREVDRAIASLPERPRDCIRLRLAGYGYAEIAELLKLSPSTARFHVFTARQRLQQELGDELGGLDD